MDAYRWSTGFSKKPWIWSACKSIVIILVAPAVSSILATNLAAIGTLGLSLRSCLAQPKYGITAVMCLADARFAASSIKRSSIKFSGPGLVEAIINILVPRIDSS